MRLESLERLVGRWMPALILFLLLAGVALRLVWLSSADLDALMRGEAWNVARAWAAGDGIADSFQKGQGPTAHIMPLVPILAGTLFRLFGEQSAITISLLTLWALGTVFGGYLLYNSAFRRLGVPAFARLGAFAVASLMPLYMSYETVSFWAWEGGLAMLLGALCLDQLIRLDQSARVGWRDVVGMSLLVAAVFYVSPALGLGAYFGGFLLMLRKFHPKKWLGVAGIVAAAAVVVLAPWYIRNIEVMGAPILLRSNFGLEMALANHPGAVTTDDKLRTFNTRYQAIHPYAASLKGYEALQAAGGEVAYAKGLGDEAKAWVAEHPGEFAGLAADHLGQMLYPPRWGWDLFGKSDQTTPVRQAIHWAITTFGLLGLVIGIRAVGWRILYVAGFALLPLLPYLIVQPTLRYRYLVYHLLLWLAFAGIGWALSLAGRVGPRAAAATRSA